MNKIYFETLVSTNDYLNELSQNSILENFTTIFCGNQLKGKGQQGNFWYSSPSKNLTFSTLLYTNIHPSNSFELNIITSISLKKTLDIFLDNVKIKWPNDIYINRKKICGILIENTLSGNNITKSIIGIGLNVNEPSFPDNIPNPTSFMIEKKREFSLTNILDSFLINFKYVYEDFFKDKKSYLDLYLKNLLFFNEKMFFEDINGTFEGKIINISENGCLIIIKSNNFEKKEYYYKEIKYIF